ncbi:FYVE, RhoGEF and PH domain-containing protein, putative [Entamoeba dispar SAW760]|uniref:FYVE, RhoGEF and PH domain-containing protein, putative n=1 Tax=Entamoeba dispar (strain ATCC PRA-260 / SAW760) TaxID=370354 RepID=B0EF14_ENTDS|nr:FYVE, RhoGEF and PH domain-containing protein, putative [Entamoeba dispar SAW760]EDR26863.1 FYVE, RhoGEF and PH domain-containing protein, putative [Entamoeba dispar SAW760]|eukprot:EDR26863.1 FYVE, RhoGEF and PH domain-containing protein, putative [Entamoeba dispar SAW760]
MNLEDFEVIDKDGNFTEVDFKIEQPTKENEEPLDQRRRIINEIYDTEESYVQGLKLCIKYYYEPLNENKGIIPKNKLDVIFLHFPDVQSMNSSFFEQLKEQKEKGKLYDCIGSIFVEFSHFFKVYKLIVGNSEAVLAVLKDVCSSPHVSRYLEQQRLRINAKVQLDLRSYLITPVQRLPRYNLLLNELLKHTPTDHPDYNNIVSALIFLKECTQYANDSVKERERRDKLITIAKTCEGATAESIVKPGRSFVKSGEVLEIGKKINKPRFIYLFNDMLMYGIGDERKLSVIGMYNIESIMIKDIKDSPNSLHCFRILSLSSSEVDITFQCETEEEKKAWFDSINNAAQDERSRLLTLRNEITINSTTVWIPDEEANECMRCGTPFTLFFRKHHCRNCGYIICANCRTRCKVPKLGRVDYVCLKCYDELQVENKRRNSLSSNQPQQIVKDTISSSALPEPSKQFNNPTSSINNTINQEPTPSIVKSSTNDIQINKQTSHLPPLPTPSHHKTESCQVQFSLPSKPSDLSSQSLKKIQQPSQLSSSEPPHSSTMKQKSLKQDTSITTPEPLDSSTDKKEVQPIKRAQPSIPQRQQSNSSIQKTKPQLPSRGNTTNPSSTITNSKPLVPSRTLPKVNTQTTTPNVDGTQHENNSFKERLAMFQQQSSQTEKPTLPIRRKANPPIN